jgi:hypothetical protein
MNKVPKGKTIYFSGRKFKEGDNLPPNIILEMPIMQKKPEQDYNNFNRKKRGRPKSTN